MDGLPEAGGKGRVLAAPADGIQAFVDMIWIGNLVGIQRVSCFVDRLNVGWQWWLWKRPFRHPGGIDSGFFFANG